MSDPTMAAALPDLTAFLENRRNYPAEQLRPYRGQIVAWSLDGKQILASAADENALHEQLRALGIDASRIIGSYVDAEE